MPNIYTVHKNKIKDFVIIVVYHIIMTKNPMGVIINVINMKITMMENTIITIVIVIVLNVRIILKKPLPWSMILTGIVMVHRIEQVIEFVTLIIIHVKCVIVNIMD
jgi:hydrogenase/urease accessory protein HupE